MKSKSISLAIYITVFIFMGLLLTQCSSNSRLTRKNIQPDASVKVFLQGGKVLEGVVLYRTDDGITLISAKDQQRYNVKFNEIISMERSRKYYDRYGYQISRAEIQKYRTNRNASGFAIGGAVIGGASGLAVGLPFWLAEIGNVPPYFTAGIGAVVGSIIYGIKGNRKDQEIALRKAQTGRIRDAELERQKVVEEQRLKELEKEKAVLLKKLRARKNDPKRKKQ